VSITGGHEFIAIDGTRYFGVWNDTSFYIVAADELTAVTYTGSSTITTDGWQAATLNDAAFLFNNAYEPIYFSPITGVLADVHEVPVSESFTITSAGTTATVNLVGHNFTTSTVITVSGANESEYNGEFTVSNVVDADNFEYTLANSTTSPATGTISLTWERFVPQANTVLSAYGRLWVADTPTNKTTVYWSNLLDGQNFASGSAGSIDLSSVLVKGNDEIVALGAQNGRLIIFCKDNIVIYTSASGDSVLDPSTMELVEVISGVGCVSRDSVQNTGTDIFFLSANGLMSLGRVIQEKSQPMRDLSKNIRDDLVGAVQSVDPTTIKSAYLAEEAFYLLLIPAYQRIYCFDTRSMMPDGSARVTIWDNQTQSNMVVVNSTLYFTQANGVATYSGYLDNTSDYYMKYYTNFFDFEDATKLKILKRVGVTAIGGNAQGLVLKAGFDYVNDYRSYATSLENLANFEYGEAEYNTTAEYSFGTIVDQVRAPLGGDGNVIQIGLEARIEGSPLSIQRLDIYVKDGRTY